MIGMNIRAKKGIVVMINSAIRRMEVLQPALDTNWIKIKNKAPKAIVMTNMKFARYECMKNLNAESVEPSAPRANRLKNAPPASRINPTAKKMGFNDFHFAGSSIDSKSYLELITVFRLLEIIWFAMEPDRSNYRVDRPVRLLCWHCVNAAKL